MAGYIGTKAAVVSSGAERKKVFDITTTTTSLTGCSYTPNQVHVFHNGVRLVDGTDYTATNGTSLTLTTAAQNGDEVVVISYATFQTSDTVSASAGGTFSGDITISGSLSVDGGTIKLDGNYPVGTANVALGDDALSSGSLSGGFNVAVGNDALQANTSGGDNTAVGQGAAISNTTGSNNAAVGSLALRLNTTGGNNTGLGTEALHSNTTASNNTAVGYQAGYTGSTNSGNTFIGYRSGYSSAVSASEGYNTCVGLQAGYSLTTGIKNTFIGGVNSGYSMTSGSSNTILGNYTGNQGGVDIRTSSNRIVLSDGDGSIGLYVDSAGNIRNRNYLSAGQGIEIENLSYGRINFYKNGTAGTHTACSFYNNVTSQVGSIVYSDSATGYNTSSDYRLKEDVQPMVNPTDRLLELNPVNFAWKSNGSRVDGFLAHEVQVIVPEAITGTKDAVDDDGNPVYQGIDQSKLVPLLTAALQEALSEIQDLKARVATLEGGAA
jgi:hypothetical protein